MRVAGIAFVAVLLAVAGAREGLAQKPAVKGEWYDFVAAVQGPGKKDPFQGKFDVTARMWRKPDEAPRQWTGTATLEEQPGGGLIAEHQGPDTGTADLGVGTFEDGTVWDLLYNVWLSLNRSYGTIDAAAKTTSHEGVLQGHVTREEVEFRYVLRFVDRDRFVVELWRLYGAGGAGGKGEPLRLLEAEYRRR
jgi:hypothetical protein